MTSTPPPPLSSHAGRCRPPAATASADLQPQIDDLQQELQDLRTTMHDEVQRLRHDFQQQLALFEQRLTGMVDRAVADKLAAMQTDNNKHAAAAATEPPQQPPALHVSHTQPSYDPAKSLAPQDRLPAVPSRRSSMMWGDDFIDGECGPIGEHEEYGHAEDYYVLPPEQPKGELPALTPRSATATSYPLQSPLLSSDSIWAMPSGATVDTQTLASHIGLTATPPTTQLHMSQDKLVWLAVKILLEQQSLPVGKLGSLLHRAANDHKLPQVLKQQFGGLKKFLQSHDSFFVLSSDHAFNPTVQLNTELHRQLKSYQQQHFASHMGIVLTPKVPDIASHNVSLTDRAQSHDVSKQTPLTQPLHRVSSSKAILTPPVTRSLSTPAYSPFPTPSPVQPAVSHANGWAVMSTKSAKPALQPMATCGRSMFTQMSVSQQPSLAQNSSCSTTASRDHPTCCGNYRRLQSQVTFQHHSRHRLRTSH